MAAPPPTQLGNQNRTEMLPVQTNVNDFLGPNYSYADELPLPGQIGVQEGDSLGSVIDAARGALYYADMIGYGEASNILTRTMDNKPYPLGINYFIKTGSGCSNGADMWYYVNGIPQGTALGKKIQEALKGMGLPQLRGLAPGIAEDAQAALDPTPILNSLFGSGYAQCKEVMLPVGDARGRIKSADGVEWVQQAYPGDLQTMQVDGATVFAQKRWIFDKWLNKEEFDAAKKLYCPDGTAIASHQGNKCEKPLLKKGVKEGWEDKAAKSSVAVVGLLFALVALRYRFRG